MRTGTDSPVPRARVLLRPLNSRTAQAITADDGGKFVFRDLPPGQYRISVTRDGYVASEYGQRSPTGSGVAINLSAQQQFRDARIALTPAGTISGRILNRYGEPAGNVNVQALRYTYQEGRRSLTPFQTIRTNDLGEYRLFWMPPGQYIISAQGTDSLSVSPNEMVMMQVARGAGGPASGPGALAGALGAQLGVGGVTRITVTGVNSDDLFPGPGAAGVPSPAPLPPPVPASVIDDSSISLAAYYPGTADVSAALPVDLRAGGDVGGINLTLVDAKPVSIRGRVLNGGSPAAGAQVSLFQRTSLVGALTVRTASVNNDTGAFEFRNIAPGTYELIATLNGFGPAALLFGSPSGNASRLTVANAGVGRGGRVPGAPVMGARQQLDVLDADIEGVSLLLDLGFDVNGRVSVEGQSAPNSSGSLAGLRIQLQPDPMIPPLTIPAVNPEDDGSFSITGVTSSAYRLSVTGLPSNTYVKSARLGGTDILSGGFRIDSVPSGSLDIVLGSSPGVIDATVVDEKQVAVPAVTVAIVPAGTQEKRYDIYRSATSDASGSIHLDGVVPGDYRIYAWESVETGAWTDPDFMRGYQNYGTPLRVAEGARVSFDVRLIPYKVN